MSHAIKSHTEYIGESFKEVTLDAEQVVDTHFSECLFIGCSLREINFSECRFNDCMFEQCDLSLISVRRCEFRQTDFRKTRISGVDWTAAIWSQLAFHSPLSFHDCDISYSTFIGLKLPGIELVNCVAKDVEFSEADLTGADFQGTVLTQSHFRNADLTRANFTNAREYQIDLLKTKVSKAKFSLPEAYTLLHSMSDIILVEM